MDVVVATMALYEYTYRVYRANKLLRKSLHG